MKVYYNEFDKKKCAALKAMMGDGHISMGDVDDRPIQEVRPHDLKGYTRCHFFAGIGGWDIALRIAGWEPDRNVWTVSCPCQDYSAAGKKERQSGKRHLWPHFSGLKSELTPTEILGEQVDDAIAAGWLDDIFLDLEEEDYACASAILPIASVESASERSRIFFVAHRNGNRFQRVQLGVQENQEQRNLIASPLPPLSLRNGPPRKDELPAPPICRGSDGISERIGLVHAIGDAIHPEVAAEFIKAYRECVA